VPLPAAEKDWEFGDPVGRQAVVEVPLSEIILIARHVRTGELHTWFSNEHPYDQSSARRRETAGRQQVS
jgi:hypothetical protein